MVPYLDGCRDVLKGARPEMTLRLNSEIELQALKARMREKKGDSAPSVPHYAVRKSKYNARKRPGITFS